MPTKTRRKQGADTAVQGTNDSSVVSKVSAAAQGYFNDDLIQHFVCKVVRRAPLINRGYYVRWRAVDHCIRKFLQITETCSKRQILSLGAGFDSLYFRLHAEGALDSIVVFEMDFPDVTQRKAALIQSNTKLKEMLGSHLYSINGPAYVSSAQYHLLGVDVREEALVGEVLDMAGLDQAAPTLILSEVVLTYMETRWSDAIIGWAANFLHNSFFVMYEQIHPNDPFGWVMQDHFLKLNSTLHALQQYPNTEAQRHRFLSKGWERCVCLDMNDFYLKMIPDEERDRVERLEPFDEFEEWHQKCSHYFILTASRGSLTAQALLPCPPVSPLLLRSPSQRPVGLTVRTVPVGLEGLGMASALLKTGQVLLTGGSCRSGRGALLRILIRGLEGWRLVCAGPSEHLGIRLYHTITSSPGGGFMIYGGRSSPLNPVRSLVKVILQPWGPAAPTDSGDEDDVRLCEEPVVCTGVQPPPRWRHTASMVSNKDKKYLFIFGGKNDTDAVLGDCSFLSVEQQQWTEMAVEGAAPEARHSHSSCSYQGGAVVFGGLGRRGAPLGDTVVLRSSERGFCWERLELEPPPCPRFSHSAHIIGENLIVVGGVWLHSNAVPGVAVVNLAKCTAVEFSLDTTSVPWPLMLHSFCSQIMDQQKKELLLMGGGGNCFSFGTHFNPQPVAVDLEPVLE